MKSLKLAIIVTFVAIAMVSAANAGPVGDKQPPTKIIHLTLQQASQNLGLVAAIYQQVTMEEVVSSSSEIFGAKVTYQGFIFEITGSREQWILFFKSQNLIENSTKNYVGKGQQ